MKEQTQRITLARTALVGLGLAILAMAMMLVSGLGNRTGIWDFKVAIQLFRSSAMIGLAGALVSLVGLFRVMPRRARRGFRPAAAGLVMGLFVAAFPLSWLARAKQVPMIHDITTDTEDPPVFQAIPPLRKNASNPIEYGGPEIARLQHEAYPDIRPLRVEASPEKVFAAALDSAKEMGWDIVDQNSAQGRLEATATTLWFGFKDDIVVRIRASQSEGKVGSVVDVRSISRVGRSDLGTNARRIWKYLTRLRSQLGAGDSSS